jgi:hypothetical protein
MSADAQRSAGNRAADAQTASAQAGIAEQQRQFDAVQKLLAPYTQTGTQALDAQGNLVGLGGSDAEQAAINQLQQGPQFQSMLKAGTNSILQNASATGGLRGGNVQGALAAFSPGLLAQVIQQRFNNLGGLTSVGENAAAGVGNAGMATGQGVSRLLQQQGSAQAGAYLNAGRSDQSFLTGLNRDFGQFVGSGGLKSVGGGGGMFGGFSLGQLINGQGLGGGL